MSSSRRLGPVRVLMFVTIMAVLSAGCDWTTFRFAANRAGFNPGENTINAGNVGSLTNTWSSATGGAVGSSPAVVSGVVYVGSGDGHLYAFDAVTGAVKWSSATGGAVGSSPAVANGVVYVGSGDGHLYAFDAVTGAVKWSSATGGAVGSSPAVVSGVVYVGSGDGHLYAFDAVTGAVKWSSATGGAVGSSPAVVNGVVYVGSGDGHLYAFDAVTGAVKWSSATGGAVGSSPAVVSGVVYVGSSDDRLYAFDAVTGAVKWSSATGGAVGSSPAVANGVVYVGSSDDRLYAFDAVTGASTWTVSTGGAVGSSPTVANGVVYVGSGDGHLYAFDAVTGAVKWTATTGGAVDSSPAVVNGAAYVGSSDDRLYVFSPCMNSESSIGLAPCDIQNAYRLPSYVGGVGKTVAIVDAYHDPNAASDLAVYRSTFGLPPCTLANGCFRQVNELGQASHYPAPNAGWAVEISLDLDMVSAACPNCNILLVEGNSSSLADLARAEDTAASLGANAISNSYGLSESSTATGFDGHYSHPGIPIVVASGDYGYAGGPQWPAVVPTVTAAGGTTLAFTGTGRGWSEQVWNDGAAGSVGGSGCSNLEPKPSWQTDTGCTHRTVADVAAVAEGLAIYDTYRMTTAWFAVGGTSASSPIIASVYALGGDTNGASDVYANPGLLFDVTQGNNGSCGGSYLCTATPGYDGPTGLGTPCGTGAFGGAIASPAGCGGSASGSIGQAPTATAPLAGYVPACRTAPPGGVRCFAYIKASR